MIARLFIVLLASGLAIPASQDRDGVDALDVGITVSGVVTFQRADETTTFTVTDPGGSVVAVKVDNKRALSDTPNDSVSYDWAHTLVHATRESFRFANRREMSVGTLVRPDSIQHVAICVPKPTERSEAIIVFTLQCLAFDDTKWQKNESGKLVVDPVMVVSATNGSTLDAFLNREQTAVYVRLEAPGR